MKKYCSTTIPTKTYLKKYLHYKLGPHIFASGPHHIQKFLTILLDKKIYNYNFTSLNTNYTDSITILITKNTYNWHGFGIKPEKIMEFNNFIEALFDEELYLFVKFHTECNNLRKNILKTILEEYGIPFTTREKNAAFKMTQIKTALEDFSKKINLSIDEDITYEAIKKMEYRARERKEKTEKIFLQPVPSLKENHFQLSFFN